MAYPADSEPKTEMMIDGVWTDVTSRVRGESKITIQRGRADEQGRVAAQRSNFTLNNRDGLFSNRNPLSAYYGLLPRNTQVRHTADSIAGETYAQFISRADGSLSHITTPDAAALDIVGDIEIRAEIEPTAWRNGRSFIVISKWQATGEQRSWTMYITIEGRIGFEWSTAGTSATRIAAFSSAASVIPPTSGKLAVRVILDVDNGAAGNTVSFYTAPSIDGTYTLLSSSTRAGITSIFSSSARVALGMGDTNAAIFGNFLSFGGKYYKARIYNGIGGTVVANPDFTSLATDALTHTDSTGKVWTFNLENRVASDRIRMVGALTTLPQVWDRSGRDVYVPVISTGPIRRLTQGAKALDSPMYRNFSRYAPHGYWPLENSGASAVSGAAPVTAQDVSYGSATGLPGAAGAAAFTVSTSSLLAYTKYTPNTSQTSFVIYVRLQALPASGSPTFLNIYGYSGLVKRIDVGLSTTAWVFNVYNQAGTLIDTQNISIGTINPATKWVGLNVLLKQNGGNVEWYARWDNVTELGAGIGPISLGAGTVGRWGYARVLASTDVAYQALQVSQIFMSTGNFDLTDDAFRQASSAYIGERAVVRMRRLAAEENVAMEVWGLDDESELMGAQTTDTFMNLMYATADADGGILAECRDRLALMYRALWYLYSRHDLTLSESSFHLTEVPVAPEDDSGVFNDVTVQTPDGASSRTVITTGALGTDEIGTYETTQTLTVANSRLEAVSEWVAFVGTFDGLRVPSLAVSLHRAPYLASLPLTQASYKVDIGGTITLTDLPDWMPPDDVKLLVQGSTETLWKKTWEIVWNTTSAGHLALTRISGDDPEPRISASSSTLKSAITSTATSLIVKTPELSKKWIDTATNPASFPVDIEIGGEVMRLTAMTAGSVVSGFLEQTATVTRSINGIVKAQAADTSVDLAIISYVAR